MRKIFLFVLLIIMGSPAMAAAGGEEDNEVADKVEDQNKVGHIDLESSKFTMETNVGVVNSTGNTLSISVSGTNQTKYRYKRFENLWRAGAYYMRVFSARESGVIGTAAKYIYGNYRFDYYLSHRVTIYAGGGGYTDEIKGIELSGEGFGGLGLYLLQGENYYLKSSVGYNYTYEDRNPPDPSVNIHSASLEMNYLQNFGEQLTLTDDLQVLQDVVHGHEVRVNNRLALNVALNKYLGIVTAFSLRFDNRPVTGFKKLDTLSELALSIKF